MHPRVRTATKAIIIRDGALLVTVNRDREGTYHLLPGGGQVPGETLPQALERECREEIGVSVDIGDLVLVRDYIGANHEFAHAEGLEHQLELMFLCHLPDGVEPCQGCEPDGPQVGYAWLPLDQLDQHRVYPSVLAEVLPRLAREPGAAPCYLGDVN